MMNRTRRLVLGLAAGLVAAPIIRSATVASGNRFFTGTWSAFLDQDNPPTRLKLVIDEDGTGHLTVIDIGDVPIQRFDISGEKLHFEIAHPALAYDAAFDGRQIKGILRRGDKDVPLVFVRGDLYTEPPLVEYPPAPLSAQRLHELRLMARAPAMGVGWQFVGGARQVLVDGSRAVDTKVAVNRHDRWHVGSITKSMTATLTARLVEAGALGWHDRIGEILGGDVKDMLPAYRDVTLLHILSHRGGLPRDVDPAPSTRRDYARAALRMPPAATPGEQMLYSNVDYVVAGLILETVTKQPWETLIAAQVFAPLGITSFGFGPPGSAGKLDQPRGHEPGPNGPRPTRYDVPEVMAPAGRVHMNLDDLLIYLAAHRDRSFTFLKEASWKMLHTPPFGGDYALGWSVSPDGVLSHGGTNQKWKAEVAVDRERGLVSCSAANILNNNAQAALLQLLASARLSK